jgi:hypothetical protein
MERWLSALALVALPGCMTFTLSDPKVESYQAAPARPSGPASPVCDAGPVATAGTIARVMVVCRGGHTVPYETMRSAAQRVAESQARSIGRTSASLTEQKHWLTTPEVTPLVCTNTTPATEWTCIGGKGCHPKWWDTPVTTQSCQGGTALPGTNGHEIHFIFDLGETPPPPPAAGG